MDRTSRRTQRVENCKPMLTADSQYSRASARLGSWKLRLLQTKGGVFAPYQLTAPNATRAVKIAHGMHYALLFLM